MLMPTHRRTAVRPLKGEVAWIASERQVQHFSAEEVTLFLTMTRGLIDRIWQRMEEIRLQRQQGPV